MKCCRTCKHQYVKYPVQGPVCDLDWCEIEDSEDVCNKYERDKSIRDEEGSDK